MRPGQNKRMRGRNRRGPNPLTRSYESNGPDVKIRGTAQHISEKYTQLARDAHASGDPVAAESYLQHAEHYYRIIASAVQAQQAAQGGGSDDRYDEEDDFDTANDRFTFRPVQAANPQAPQPYLGDRQPAEFGEGSEEASGGEEGGERPQRPAHHDRRGNRGDRGDRGERGERGDRFYRDRDRGERNDRGDRGDRGERADRGERVEGGERPPRAPRPPVAAESDEQPVLPAFLTAPVRAGEVEVEGEEGEARSPFRNRRRRRGPRSEAGTFEGAEGGEG